MLTFFRIMCHHVAGGVEFLVFCVYPNLTPASTRVTTTGPLEVAGRCGAGDGRPGGAVIDLLKEETTRLPSQSLAVPLKALIMEVITLAVGWSEETDTKENERTNIHRVDMGTPKSSSATQRNGIILFFFISMGREVI